ncbi:immunoglobulin superfamily member 6-like [Anomaloglossus baeobatrachus]|uniref:immunoglobulin superfamily member 6-like n=1 Tax=Anomaloglossus baeobatrachus TaxID=238106 RepID=UPI003F4F7D21
MKLQLVRSSIAFLIIFSLWLTGTIQGRLVVTQPAMVKAEVGESVTITCSFTSEFPAYSVTWTIGCNSTEKLQNNPCYQQRVNISFPDAVQTPDSSQVPTYEGKTAITINKLTENDSGTFCCHIKTNKEPETGAGTRLKVTTRPSPKGKQNKEIKIYIFYAVIGAEACVIVILMAVVIRNHPRGLSRPKEQDLQSDPSGLQYAEIGKKSFPKRSRPKVEVDAVTYSTVKVNNEEYLSSHERELYYR